MVITKYGRPLVYRLLTLMTVVALLDWYLVEPSWLRIALLGFDACLAALVLNFFRDPERVIPQQKNIVISPADGKVVLIREVIEDEYLKQDSVQVSIFMSPLDVHVNRFPISGIVGYFQHVQGEYIVAFDDKASERNERTLIGVECNGYKVLFKQIAGAVARRIVAPVAVGQQADAGVRFGMIRFGSRVDVIMPNSTEIAVKLNDRVTAGETILGRFSAFDGLGRGRDEETNLPRGMKL